MHPFARPDPKGSSHHQARAPSFKSGQRIPMRNPYAPSSRTTAEAVSLLIRSWHTVLLNWSLCHPALLRLVESIVSAAPASCPSGRAWVSVGPRHTKLHMTMHTAPGHQEGQRTSSEAGDLRGRHAGDFELCRHCRIKRPETYERPRISMSADQNDSLHADSDQRGPECLPKSLRV